MEGVTGRIAASLNPQTHAQDFPIPAEFHRVTVFGGDAAQHRHS